MTDLTTDPDLVERLDDDILRLSLDAVSGDNRGVSLAEAGCLGLKP